MLFLYLCGSKLQLILLVMTFILMPIVFVLGVVGIAFEDKLHINKSAIALLMCVILWGLLIVTYHGNYSNELFRIFLEHNPALADASRIDKAQAYVAESLNIHLGDVAGTLFFVLCSMLIVNTVDRYGGFKEIAAKLATANKRRLIWHIGFLAFFFSALLDNLAAAIVVIAIIRKLVPDKTDRMKYACISVIACNAGGSWSPIGDVTTLLLWQSGYITPFVQISRLFIPALVNLLVPLTISHFWLFRKGDQLRQVTPPLFANKHKVELPGTTRVTVFIIGFLSLVMVPVYEVLFGIPAYMGAIIGLIILWIYTDRMQLRLENAEDLKVVHLLKDADLSSLFYFLGVLMSVAALITGGQLAVAGGYLERVTDLSGNQFADTSFLAAILGVLSSAVDNVALVAATMGMFPAGYNAAMVVDGSFWLFLAYAAVTGGSLLIIGSATGVTVMGLEGVTFGYYLKRFSGLALVGYIAGAMVALMLV